MSLESFPDNGICDYLLEAAEVEEEEEEKAEGKEIKPDNEKSGDKAEVAGKKGGRGKSSLVIFVVDVSGSMSSTITVPDLQG